MPTTKMPPTFQEKDLNYYLRMIRTDYSKLEELQPQKTGGSSHVKNVVIVFTSDHIGSDKKMLGKKLLMHFLQALINGNTKPKAIILLNGGVQLACSSNETISKLTVLEEQGAKIMACISSLQEYSCLEKLSVGFEASMEEICETMMSALKVITF
ncbi:MAG: hypothetical protein ACLFQV_03850 [Vulcanimicrobiota bacterium]